jgi:hypothetical protein
MEHFKKITWKVLAEAYGFTYDYSYAVFSNTSDNSTLLIWEWENDNPEICLMTSKMIDGFKSTRYDMIKRWEKFLSSSTDDLNQFESIIIYCDRKSAFDVISNWTVLREVAPTIADNVEYEGVPTELNTKLKISFVAKKMICYLKVIKCDNDELSNEWLYHLECYDGKPKVPLQEIHFSVVKIKDDSCYLSFRHVFKQPVKIEIIDTISTEKRNILKLIKIYLEEGKENVKDDEK